jgi:predicted transcriptional regulator
MKKKPGAKMGRPRGRSYPHLMTTRVDDDLKEKIDGIAETEGLGPSEVVRLLLELGVGAWKRAEKKEEE